MKTYRLSAAAQQDLWQIKNYSLNLWGKELTQDYLSCLETTLEQLVLSPERGKKRDELIVGLRSFTVKQHVIFYRYGHKGLEVARILHIKMNAPAYF